MAAAAAAAGAAVPLAFLAPITSTPSVGDVLRKAALENYEKIAQYRDQIPRIGERLTAWQEYEKRWSDPANDNSGIKATFEREMKIYIWLRGIRNDLRIICDLYEEARFKHVANEDFLKKSQEAEDALKTFTEELSKLKHAGEPLATLCETGATQYRALGAVFWMAGVTPKFTAARIRIEDQLAQEAAPV